MTGYSVRYDDRAVAELARLDRSAARKILEAIEHRLLVAPDSYGKPLRHPLAGLRRLRVGDYRVVYKVAGRQVIVLRVGHAHEAYS